MEKYASKLPRMAAIHDLSGLGKCSLTVALPIVSASGVECACIPTALLSTHTGGFKGFTFCDLSDEIVPIAEHWNKLNMHFDAIYSGYLASKSQGELLERAIDLMRNEKTLVIVDPAMADNGHFYTNLDEGMVDCFRKLIKKADVICPNITEACFLTGTELLSAPQDMRSIETLLDKLSELGPKLVVITGISLEAGKIGIAARDNATGKTSIIMSDALQGSFHGSGDVFGAALAALLTKGASTEDALSLAESFVFDSIRFTADAYKGEHYGLDFEAALPQYILKSAELFK